jgi:hypothetical protein
MILPRFRRHPASAGIFLDFILNTASYSLIPFRNYHQFDVETVCLMTEAYDAALLHLGITASDPRSGNVAACIARHADDGERNPARLCAVALAELGLPTKKLAG